jgi:hypothetical protein
MKLLEQICDLWLKQVDLCKQRKWDQFGKTAHKAWGFLGKSYRDLYLSKDGDSDEFPHATGPFYKTRLNKSREFVSLMLPYVHQRVPNRVVTPRRPELPPELVAAMATGGIPVSPTTSPDDRMRAWLMEWWLNYLPGEYNLNREARTAIQEALVKGRGVVWTEMVDGPYGEIPASYYDSVDNLLIDADCVQMRDAGFIIRRRQRQVWRVAEEFGIDPDKLRGQSSSALSQAIAGVRDSAITGDSEESKGDICVYYEIWSRMGVGHRLVGASEEMKQVADALDAIGPYVHLVIAPGVPYPLNLPPELVQDSVISQEEMLKRLEWPIAFCDDAAANPWPCTCLDFYPNCDNPWASSPLEAGMAMQVFLDHLYSFIMSRVRSTCRDIIVLSKGLEADVKNAIESGLDQVIAQYNGEPGVDLQKLIQIVKFEPVNRDLWQVVAIVERAFEQATGISPLLAGGQPPAVDRSATATQARESRLSSRPDDFADMVEEWMSRIAAKEAQATRLYVGSEIVAPLFGEDVTAMETGMAPLTAKWATLVNTDDPAVAAAELSYSVESGSGRRKNRGKMAADVTQLAQTFAPAYLQLAMGGNPGPLNGLIGMIGEAYEIPVATLMFPVIQPPAQPTGAPEEEMPTEETQDALV